MCTWAPGFVPLICVWQNCGTLLFPFSRMHSKFHSMRGVSQWNCFDCAPITACFALSKHICCSSPLEYNSSCVSNGDKVDTSTENGTMKCTPWIVSMALVGVSAIPIMHSISYCLGSRRNITPRKSRAQTQGANSPASWVKMTWTWNTSRNTIGRTWCFRSRYVYWGDMCTLQETMYVNISDKLPNFRV